MNADKEWNELVEAWQAGELDARGRRRLAELCENSDELRRATADLLEIDRLMEPALRDPAGEELVTRLRSSLESEEKKSVASFPWRFGMGWAAALLGLAVLFWGLTRDEESLGVVARAESVIWLDGEIEAGRNLARGQRLRAASGLLDLRLGNGSRLILEGPFDIYFEKAGEALLREGRLSATCPPSAHGFIIRTPDGEVVDLGTEFGVITGGGHTEVHVMTGMVEMTPEGAQTYSLFQGESLSVREKKTSLGRADGSRFIRSFPDQALSQGGYIHWSFDEEGDEPARDHGEFLAMGHDATLQWHRAGEAEFGRAEAREPVRVPGVRGRALRFDGLGGYARSAFPGIGGSRPRTVAMWLRVPEGDRSAGMGLISWGSATESGVWQVALNWSGDEYTVGRLRLGTYGGKVMGTTDLCDGEWHHIAVVLGEGSAPEQPGDVLLYVDGRLEPISMRHDFRVDTNLSGPNQGVVLGKHSVPVPTERNFFRGELDEVYLFDRALVREEIVGLMERE